MLHRFKKPTSVNAGWLGCFLRWDEVKKVKLAGETDSAYQNLKISANCYTGKVLCGRTVFNDSETGLFYKDIGK